MHLDHINISAPIQLLEKVRDFYCAVFGLEDGFRPVFRQNGFWLYSGDKPIIHLSESDLHMANTGQGCLDHVAFRATGLREQIERLDSQQVEYRSNHVPELDMTQLFFRDPAGTGLEVNFLGEAL